MKSNFDLLQFSMLDRRVSGHPAVDTSSSDQLAILSGELSAAQASLSDQTHITSIIGVNVTQNDDDILFGESSQIQMASLGPYTGEFWGSTISDMLSGSGTITYRLLTPTYAPNGGRSKGGQQVWKFPVAPSSVVLSYFTGGLRDDLLTQLDIVDMASTLAQPWDIYIAAGQSNMAATTKALEEDYIKDHWSDPRLLAWPGSTHVLWGQVRDEINALHAPLQMNPATDEATDDGYTRGVSPAIAFGKRILAATPAGRNVVIVAAAWSGSDLTASDAGWNEVGSDPYAYDFAVNRANACIAAAPVGSVVKGVIWAQGEGDTQADMSDYPPAFASMRTAFQTAIGSGVIPWIILTGLPDGVATFQEEFLNTQTYMDQDSGHAYAQTGVYSVPRDIGHETDGTHSDAEGNRIVGIRAGDKMVELLTSYVFDDYVNDDYVE